jgi:peptidoglycan hydrolase CwlO-like protein
VPGWQRAAVGWPGYTPSFPAAVGPLMTKEQELEALKNQAKYFEQALDDLQKRISEIESSAESSNAK